jgi:putative Holliday junction resolvase
MKGPILAIDPGEARIGLAVSDPGRRIARPLRVLRHTSRAADAGAIAEEAKGLGATLLLVGLPLDVDGEAGPRARKAMRLADALRSQTPIPVETWDESGSTQAAAALPRSRAKLDARAAALILQDYLDAHSP